MHFLTAYLLIGSRINALPITTLLRAAPQSEPREREDMKFLDKYGWPIERIKGRWFFNLLRILIHTRKIKEWPDLKFKIDSRWEPRSWLDRFCARHVARMLFRANGATYQFGGWTGAKKLAYEMVDADKFQLMHWVLRESGYRCCPADVMKRFGVNPEKDEENQQQNAGKSRQ